MRKIPTVFQRDPDDLRYVVPTVNPGCEWVLAGEGTPSRKFDGTCVGISEDGEVYARRTVKPGVVAPPRFSEVDHDETTGKRIGWEPAGQSSFAECIQEALHHAAGVDGALRPGTYELCGPKVNGNPEGFAEHQLVRHGNVVLEPTPGDYWGLKQLLENMPSHWEGIVWAHPDGRMAKLKRRDFA